jgi:hypothetical protein
VRVLLIKNSKFDKKYIEDWLPQFDEALGECFQGQFEQVWQDSKSKH